MRERANTTIEREQPRPTERATPLRERVSDDDQSQSDTDDAK